MSSVGSVPNTEDSVASADADESQDVWSPALRDEIPFEQNRQHRENETQHRHEELPQLWEGVAEQRTLCSQGNHLLSYRPDRAASAELGPKM